MNDKTITDFEAYLEKSKAKSISLSKTEDGLQIASSLFTFKIRIDLALFAAVALGSYSMSNGASELIPIILIHAVVLGILWVDFNSINIVKIDLMNKRIQVSSRNIFKQALPNFIVKSKTEFSFTDISSFTVRSNESFDIILRKFYIDLISKENNQKAALNFSNEGEARTTAIFLTDIVRNN